MEVKPTMPLSQCGRQSSWLTSSPDHLIGLQEDGRGNRQTKGLGGLQVDDQLELGGLLHGEVGRFGIFEDLVHIGGGAPMAVREARPIGHQAPSLHIHFPYEITRNQMLALRCAKYNGTLDQVSVRYQQRLRETSE